MHSAYMLFYQRCEPGDTKPKVPQDQTVELSKELAKVKSFVDHFIVYVKNSTKFARQNDSEVVQFVQLLVCLVLK